MGRRQGWIAAAAIIVVLSLVLAGYKFAQHVSLQEALAAAQEPVEAVASARARVVPFAQEARSIGTVVATRTVELRTI